MLAYEEDNQQLKNPFFSFSASSLHVSLSQLGSLSFHLGSYSDSVTFAEISSVHLPAAAADFHQKHQPVRHHHHKWPD
jgi:hypothetical protein